MKRKVNRVGINTLTVSLPSKWAKDYNIQAGEEVEIEEIGNELTIRTGAKKNSSKISMDLSNTKSMLNRTICAIYKAGFNEVIFKYSTPEELNKIQQTLDRTCHVFEIMDYKKNRVDVGSISSLEVKDFDSIFRKLGFIVPDIAHETLEALEKNDHELLKSVILKDKIVDRHTDFCRRILNSGHSVNYKRPFPLYVICEQSEVVADIYKTLSEEVVSSKIKVEKDLLNLLKEINKLVDLFFKALYSFNMQDIIKLGEMEVGIKKLINEVSNKSRKDSKVLCLIVNIFNTAFEMKSALLTLYVGQNEVY